MSDATTLWLMLAALPLLLALATAFTKTVVVLSALRVGLGAESLLTAPLVFALAILVAAIVMAPTGVDVVAALDLVGGPQSVLTSGWGALPLVLQPLLSFLERHADPIELQFFADHSDRLPRDWLVLLPAFIVTELGEALSMSVIILVPLVLVDLVVAQALVLLGLTNQSPTLIVLPLKLVLFLGVGGWDVVIGG